MSRSAFSLYTLLFLEISSVSVCNYLSWYTAEWLIMPCCMLVFIIHNIHCHMNKYIEDSIYFLYLKSFLSIYILFLIHFSLKIQFHVCYQAVIMFFSPFLNVLISINQLLHFYPLTKLIPVQNQEDRILIIRFLN